MNEDKIELSNKLKAINKSSQKYDEQQLREQYRKIMGQNIDIDTGNRAITFIFFSVFTIICP